MLEDKIDTAITEAINNEINVVAKLALIALKPNIFGQIFSPVVLDDSSQIIEGEKTLLWEKDKYN